MIWSLIRPPSFTSHGKSGKPARAVLWLLLVGIPSSKIYHSEFAVVGRDAKRLVILKGDFESGEEKGGQLKEEIARKYSAYFQSILHHNNGYFLTVSAILTTTSFMWSTHTLMEGQAVLIAAAHLLLPLAATKWISPPAKLSPYAPRAKWGSLRCHRNCCIVDIGFVYSSKSQIQNIFQLIVLTTHFSCTEQLTVSPTNRPFSKTQLQQQGNNNNNNKNKNCNDNNNEGNGTATAKVKAMGFNLTCSVSGVRGAQPDHCGWQHLPHRLLPGRTIHEVRRQ